MKATNESIRTFVALNSYFQKQSYNLNDLTFSTRKHAWNDNRGEADVKEAYRLRKLIIEKYNNVEAYVDGSDEWVSLNVNLN